MLRGTQTLLLVLSGIMLIPALSVADDVRGLDLGDPCLSVRASEESRGSTTLFFNPNGSSLFQGQDFGRQVELAYECSSGHLAQANYFFPEEASFDQATATFKTIRDRLMSLYGKPDVDKSDADLNVHYTSWSNDRRLAILVVTSSKQAKPSYTVVLTIVPALPPEFRTQ